jgi:N,N'-diacetylchitobiose transport system substrate-binding protein
MSRRLLFLTTALAALTAAPAIAQSQTLTVWAMQDMHTEDTYEALKAAFAELHPDVTVDIQIQQWDGITTKLTTGLSQANPPDVVEIGNTYVPLFAASGALADLSAHREELERGQEWLAGLAGPSTYDGAIYAVPLFNGSGGVVIYNTEIWQAAGVESEPETFTEFTAALDRVRAANPDENFSPFYYPARNWKGNVPFLWDAGGELAVNEDGRWVARINTPESIAGLTAWRDFQNTYSIASSRNVGTNSPDTTAVFANGQASAILGGTSAVRRILAANPELEDKLGTFALPSASGKVDKPLFLGGDVLAIASRSENFDLALDWLKVATSEEIQVDYIVGSDGFGPISRELITRVVSEGLAPPLNVPFFEAAANSVSTPASPGWASVENDGTLDGLFADIATGTRTPEDAANAFAAHLEQALNVQ